MQQSIMMGMICGKGRHNKSHRALFRFARCRYLTVFYGILYQLSGLWIYGPVWLKIYRRDDVTVTVADLL